VWRSFSDYSDYLHGSQRWIAPRSRHQGNPGLLHLWKSIAVTCVPQRYLIVGREGRTRHILTGDPSDTNCSS
jgi:hypothetical protein